MEPTRNTHATLIDLLDRILDKGLVIHADIIVSVAGVPLIGVNLRTALAGMETMLKYGVMQAWDEKTRTWEKEYRKKKEISLLQGEEVILKMLGSYYYSQGIYTAWRYGYLFLTNKRLILFHGDFGEILFEIPLEKIRGLAIRHTEYFTQYSTREELYLLLEGDKVARLSATDVGQLKNAIKKRICEMGLNLERELILPVLEQRAIKFLTKGEQIICNGKMWYLMDNHGILGNTWRPGYLYLTDKRLCWWHDFKQKAGLEIPIDKLIATAMEIRNLSSVLKGKKVLDVLYASDGLKKVACFSGKDLEEWDKILMKIISSRELETETCPQCGMRAPVKELLGKGCSRCGWVSPKMELKIKN